MRGKYICLEGNDNSGKSTLADAIQARLGDKEAVLNRFPSEGYVGSLIREGLMGKKTLREEAYLYLFAADGLNEEYWIQDHLVNDFHVICDRHPTLSGRVFQLEHHPNEHIEAVYNSAAADGISMPDHLFVLDVPAEVALERMKGRDKYEDVVFEKKDPQHIDKMRQRYLGIAERFSGTVLDGTLPTEELVELVLNQAGLR